MGHYGTLWDIFMGFMDYQWDLLVRWDSYGTYWYQNDAWFFWLVEGLIFLPYFFVKKQSSKNEEWVIYLLKMGNFRYVSQRVPFFIGDYNPIGEILYTNQDSTEWSGDKKINSAGIHQKHEKPCHGPWAWKIAEPLTKITKKTGVFSKRVCVSLEANP